MTGLKAAGPAKDKKAAAAQRNKQYSRRRALCTMYFEILELKKPNTNIF
jgi:hypothetical protein